MNNNQRSIIDMTVKEGITYDVMQIIFRNSVIIDPAPMPFIPITPVVVGKKVFNYAKKIAVSIQKADR